MRRHRQPVQAGQGLSQADKCSVDFAAANVSHASTVQRLENQDVTLRGVMNHPGKINLNAIALGSLAERRVGAVTGLVVIAGVNLGISLNMVFRRQALNRSAILWCVSHHAAFGPLRREELRHLPRYVDQPVEVRNLAIIGKGPKDALGLCVMKYRSKWSTICDCCLSLCETPPAAALRKGAPGDDAGPTSRKHSVGHPQAFSWVIRGSNVLATVDCDRAIDRQFAGEQPGHEFGFKKQVALW